MSVESTQRIQDEAGRWLLKRDSGEWSALDASQFDAWMNASMRHSVEYWRLENAWEKAQRLKALSAGSTSTEPPPPGQWNLSPFYSSRKAQHATIIERWRAIAASLAVVAVLATAWMLLPSAKTFSTPLGGVATVPMADGSKVTLNTDSAIQAAITGTERRIDLKRGEAFFDVAKDPLRPFYVTVGDSRVVAVGTKFAVRGDQDVLQIVVTEGMVRIQPQDTAAPAGESLPAGSIARFAGGKWTIERRTISEAEEALSWRNGMLVFRNVTLAQAAAEFNRYNQRKMVIEDTKAALLPVSGNFSTTGVESFVDILGRGYPVRAENEGNRILITSDQ